MATIATISKMAHIIGKRQIYDRLSWIKANYSTYKLNQHNKVIH